MVIWSATEKNLNSYLGMVIWSDTKEIGILRFQTVHCPDTFTSTYIVLGFIMYFSENRLSFQHSVSWQEEESRFLEIPSPICPVKKHLLFHVYNPNNVMIYEYITRSYISIHFCYIALYVVHFTSGDVDISMCCSSVRERVILSTLFLYIFFCTQFF